MQKVILSSLALLTIAWSSFAAVPAKSKKHRQPAATAPSTPARGAKVLDRAAKTSGRRKGKLSRSSWRSSQAAPTAERYKEIQQALAGKGYFNDEPNGAWGPGSMDALKRFQADQNLMPDGKINSLSLIALGLGPKRLAAKSEVTPSPQPAVPPVTPVPPQ